MNEHEIHEELNQSNAASIWVGIGLLWLVPFIRLWTSDKKLSDLSQSGTIALVVALALMTLFMLGLRLLTRCARLTVDAEGVTVKEFQKARTIRWEEVRTAAVVRLNQRTDMTVVVLSVQQPEEVLFRKHFFKSIPQTGEVRFPVTDRRLAAVEHYLDRNLKEFQL